MDASYNDGQTARSQTVRLVVQGGDLVFDADGEQRWPLAGLTVERLEERRLRLASATAGAARLTLAHADWRRLTGDAIDFHQGQRRRRVRLVVGLAAAALGLAGLIFVVIPAASGPLARATPSQYERRMGDSLEAQLSLGLKPCGGAAGQADLTAFGRRLGATAGTPFDIRVRAVHAPMVNAFALPGGAILVTDQLIALTESPDELAAVIAHETAHVRQRHVMQAVWRSFGFGALLDAVVGGGTGAGQQLVLLAGSATNLRYSREAEAEADRVGQDLLVQQGLSSEGMARFFKRLVEGRDDPRARQVSALLSDHPDTEARVEVSRARAKPGAEAFTVTEWRDIKGACHDGSAPLKRLRWPA